MRFVTSIRTMSLALTASMLAFAGAAQAQNTEISLSGANVQLDHTLSTQTARKGQQVEAKLLTTVKTANGFDLARGTELWGTVNRVQPSENSGPSVLSVVFTAAQLKNGTKVPVKVTLLGAYPAREAEQAIYGNQMMGAAPKRVSGQQKIVQEPGLLNHISMQSAVQNSNSGTFRRNDGNLRLIAGTRFQVGIAPAAQSGAMSSGAE